MSDTKMYSNGDLSKTCSDQNLIKYLLSSNLIIYDFTWISHEIFFGFLKNYQFSWKSDQYRFWSLKLMITYFFGTQIFVLNPLFLIFVFSVQSCWLGINPTLVWIILVRHLSFYSNIDRKLQSQTKIPKFKLNQRQLKESKSFTLSSFPLSFFL